MPSSTARKEAVTTIQNNVEKCRLFIGPSPGTSGQEAAYRRPSKSGMKVSASLVKILQRRRSSRRQLLYHGEGRHSWRSPLRRASVACKPMATPGIGSMALRTTGTIGSSEGSLMVIALLHFALLLMASELRYGGRHEAVRVRMHLRRTMLRVMARAFRAVGLLG
jgi:hypothetical protein